MPRFFVATVTAVLALTWVQSAESMWQETDLEVESAKWSIEQLVQLGIAQNPGVKEAQHRIQSIRHRVPQETSLPDPVISTTTHLAPVETAAGPQAFSLGINQKITNRGRRSVRAAIANAELLEAKSNLELRKQELAERIRVACFQILSIQESIRITKEDLQSLAQIEEVILRQYEVKKSVSQQNVLNVQIEQSKVENQLADLKQKEKSYTARIARLLHMEPGTSIVLSDQLGNVSTPESVDDLIAQAQEARPELSAQLARVKATQHRVKLASLQSKPDFTIGLNWIATSSEGISPVANGDDALLLGIGFNLPVNKARIRAAVCEANHNSLAESAKLESLLDQVSEEVFDTVAQLESTASTLLLLADDIVPKAERSLELSIDEYSNGKTEYSQLIANWRSLLRYRVALTNLQSQRLQLIARLSRQVGRLESISTNQNGGGS